MPHLFLVVADEELAASQNGSRLEILFHRESELSQASSWQAGTVLKQPYI
jgi:hypothetical protein